MNRQTDIIIIGGGCAGWFASLELARRGIASIILDTHRPAAFASTRNQGWLQSGAWYAAVSNDPITARACRDGYHWIRSHYPEAIRPGIPCYFLMHREEDLQQCLARCRQEDIMAYPILIDALKDCEPILGNSNLTYAAEMPDIPVDTTRLLQVVAEEACQKGVRFEPVDSLETITPVWNGNTWRLSLDHDREIQAKSVILTCGVYIPKMLRRFVPDQVSPFKQTKIPVVVLHGEVARSMLVTIYAPHGPNIVPFHGRTGHGATVCLYQADEAAIDHQDTTLSPCALERYAESFSTFYSGLSTMITQRGSIQAHVYVCQKLLLNDFTSTNPSSRKATCLAYAPPLEGQKNLFVFYPGKFTAAPIAAQACVEEVVRNLSNQFSSGSQFAQPMPAPTIARQRYYDPPAYALAIKNGGLAFDPIG